MMLIPPNTGAACPLQGSNWRLNATQSGSDSLIQPVSISIPQWHHYASESGAKLYLPSPEPRVYGMAPTCERFTCTETKSKPSAPKPCAPESRRPAARTRTRHPAKPGPAAARPRRSSRTGHGPESESINYKALSAHARWRFHLFLPTSAHSL
ncbi:hypothetical protein N656DRAFT_470771 [Canariomyces notabilis]|uniref:Uncharacterized protein n=1 Tax=Canariomyces notabilis TaxID=2074819 RepID=A0AAN6T8F6_9PEZI|nr:hypothetical protein N656DRAFT_470771 [Canariomyces arenarius]